MSCPSREDKCRHPILHRAAEADTSLRCQRGPNKPGSKIRSRPSSASRCLFHLLRIARPQYLLFHFLTFVGWSFVSRPFSRRQATSGLINRNFFFQQIFVSSGDQSSGCTAARQLRQQVIRLRSLGFITPNPYPCWCAAWTCTRSDRRSTTTVPANSATCRPSAASRCPWQRHSDTLVPLPAADILCKRM